MCLRNCRYILKDLWIDIYKSRTVHASNHDDFVRLYHSTCRLKRDRKHGQTKRNKTISLPITDHADTYMLALKLRLKHSTYSVVMPSLCTQDTKSTGLPMIPLSFMAPKQPLNVKMKPQPTKQQPQNPEALQEYFLSHKISQVSFTI